MFRLRAARVAIGVVLAAGPLLEAQQPALRLSIQDGRVALHADNVPVRTILAEWARIGGTRVVNGERISGAPVSLDLKGVSEREVLDILLRGVSGYVLGARTSPAAGASAFDRILILAGSAPPTSAVPTVNPRARVIPQMAPPPEGDPNGNPPGEPAFGDAQRAMPGGPRFSTGGRPSGPVPAPPPFGQPQGDGNASPQPPAVGAAPGNPFGVPTGSSSKPGIVTPAPDPAIASQRQTQDQN